MAIAYKYIKVVDSNTGTKYNVGLLDQVTMYSTGNASQPNDGTLKVGTTYNISGVCVFLAVGGNIVRAVSGSGGGLSFEFKEETTPSTNVGGYYINGSKVCSWVSGLGGIYIVYLYKDYQDEKYYARRLTSGPGTNALFYNGVCFDGSSLTPSENQEGWSRIIKGDFKSNGNVIMHVNNATGAPSGRYAPFGFATGSSSAYGPYNITPGGEVDPTNPYSDGGYSEPGGGDPGKQNFGDVSDIVNPDALPDETEIGAVGCGLITIFSPDQSQLTRLAEMLWNKTFYDFLVNQFNAIEDLFVSLGIVPFTVTKGAPVAISFMNFWEYLTPGPIPTQVVLTKAAKQWEEFNLGNVSLTGGDSSNAHASDSVLDYSPYSKLGIYLPFIGYQEMDIDECRGRTINLKYRVDILSGACLALISINGRTLYQFTGNCMTQLPLTSSDYSQIVSTATNVSIAAASAGTAGALASAGDALTSSRVESGQISPQMGEYQNAQHAAQVSNAEGSLAGATANGLMGLKPSYKKTGAISGSTSIFGVMQPYLVLTTPKQSMPDGYNKVCGFPCNMGGKLGDFSGFTVVEDIRLNGLIATSPEVEEIYKLLKTGVII